MTKSSNVAIAITSSLLVCSTLLLANCSERRPAGSDRPKTKEKTVKGSDLKIFKDNKKAEEQTPETTEKKPESIPATPETIDSAE